MNLEQKLEQYEERKKEIADQRKLLDRLEDAHTEQTESDFGIADGQCLSVSNFVKAFMKMNEK